MARVLPSVTNPLFWLLVVTLPFPACDCGKKQPPPDDGPVTVQDVGTRMSVTSIDPSRVPPDQGFTAILRGSGFAPGADVSVGGRAATNVTHLSSSQLGADIPGLPVGRYDVTVTNDDGTSSTLRGGLVVDSAGLATGCDPVTIYFDTDKSVVRPDGRSAIDAKATCYTGTTASVHIAGHCDERGTTDYNLALGQRRADAAKTYLVGKGVSASRVQTTSYGEEQPADPGHDESAWQRNRRAEIGTGH